MSRKKSSKNKNICLVCSSGGHLLKTYQLVGWWKMHPHFWVTEKDVFSQSLLKAERTYFGNFPVQRNILSFFANFLLALRLLSKEKPSYIFSTGAGIAPPFFLAAKILRCKTIFMETFIFIPKPTLSGRLCYLLTDNFLVQNKKLLRIYPKAKYLGSVL